MDRNSLAPQEADPFVEETWRAANPALGTFLNVDEVKAQAETARRMPSMESSFRNLILNQRIESVSQFVSPTVWQENGDPPGVLTADTVLNGALDLSAVHDLTAAVFVGGDGSVYRIAGCPRKGLRKSPVSTKSITWAWCAMVSC